MHTVMNQKHTILLINNDLAENPMLMALSQQGYAVLTAQSSYQALSLLSDTAVDLLIIDSEIADMKGVDFLHHLRRHNRYATLPVLMLVEEELVAPTITC